MSEVVVAPGAFTGEPAEVDGGEAGVDELFGEVLGQHRRQARGEHVAPGDPLDVEALGAPEVVLDLVEPGTDPDVAVLVAHLEHPHELLAGEVGEAQVGLERSAVVGQVDAGSTRSSWRTSRAPSLKGLGVAHRPLLVVRVDLEVDQRVPDCLGLLGRDVGDSRGCRARRAS